MTTYRLPEELAALVGEEIAGFVEAYTPTTLSAQVWGQVQAEVCELTARTEPCSCADARIVLNALCQLLAWAHPITGSWCVKDVLTWPTVERFAAEMKGRLSASGRDNYRGRLRRCLRVLDGEPARTKRSVRGAGSRPYDVADRTSLRDACADDPELTEVLREGMDLGRIAPRGSSRAHRLPGPDPDLWARARAVAAAAGCR